MTKALWILLAAVSVVCGGCATGPISIDGTEFQGSIWSRHQNDASIISQDGGFSFAVPGGTVWAFGDTFLGRRAPDGAPHFKGGGIFCSIAFLPEGDRSFPPPLQYKTGPDGIAASPLALLPGEPSGVYCLWPLSGIRIDSRSYLYYSVIRKTGDGAWDFQEVGSGLACAESPLGDYKRLQPDGDWRFPVAPTQAVRSGPWLYLYEIIKRGDEIGAALARVKASEIGLPEAYEYYDRQSDAFRKDRSAQSILVPAAGQVSVAFDPYCDGWLMATSSDLFHPRRISLYLAPRPKGPWNLVGRIEVPEKCQGKKVELVYCTYFHPELFRNGGEIVNLTFSLHLEQGGFDVNCEMAEVRLRRNDD